MKLVVFGGFIFLGGCILAEGPVYQNFGTILMLIGGVIGIIGTGVVNLVYKGKDKEKDKEN